LAGDGHTAYNAFAEWYFDGLQDLVVARVLGAISGFLYEDVALFIYEVDDAVFKIEVGDTVLGNVPKDLVYGVLAKEGGGEIIDGPFDLEVIGLIGFLLPDQ
jgi:hypothetical protein